MLIYTNQLIKTASICIPCLQRKTRLLCQTNTIPNHELHNSLP